MTTSTKQYRLSQFTRDLAERGLSGEFGRQMIDDNVRLDDYIDSAIAPFLDCYARAILLIAENVPVRIIPGDLLVGAAVYKSAARHVTPILRYGKQNDPNNASRECTSTSHVTLGFDRALHVGYGGLRRQIDERLSRGDLQAEGTSLLRAMQHCLDAADIWHSRYVLALEDLISTSSDEQREHYRSVLNSLRNVPENPPSAFREAVQSLWFIFAFQRLCGNWSGLGRIDEMLGPYLERDLTDGRITLDQARELLAHFWINGTEWIGGCSSYYGGDAQHYQNIILAGVDVAGREIENEVTHLVLDIAEELQISDFPIAVRINGNSSEKLLRHIADTWRSGAGFVSIYNEDIVIEAMCKFGYSTDEARRFTNDGCWEPQIPGKTMFTYQAKDMLADLQIALGLDDESKDIPSYQTFEDLYSTFRESLAATIDRRNIETDDFLRGSRPQPLVSLFTEDCIEKGRDYYDFGSRYTVSAIHMGGLANVANSLLVLKKLVYDEEQLSIQEFIRILRTDWEGAEDLRRSILNRFAFYGNDNDEADGMMTRVFDDYTDLAWRERDRNGILRPAGISTFGREVGWLGSRCATADGHRRGEILAGNFGPSPGTDRNGPLATIKSYCKADFTKLSNCGTLDLKILPASVKGENGLNALVSLMRAFVSLGGMYVNIQLIDTETLIDAQRHPEKYPHLSVRIAGWNARFATLDKQWQQLVISRTQKELR